MKKEEDKKDKLIKCECGYNNKEFNVKIWGTCTRCKRIIDEKAYFKRQMFEKMRLWRGKLK